MAGHALEPPFSEALREVLRGRFGLREFHPW
jgi:hypothetical protein